MKGYCLVLVSLTVTIGCLMIPWPGSLSVDPKGLLLRFQNDLVLIANEEKQIMSMCEYLRYLATEKGIGSVSIEDHSMQPRMREAVFQSE